MLNSFLLLISTLFTIRNDANPHRIYGGFNRRDFKHGHKPLTFVIPAITMRPAVAAFSLWVSCQIENLNLSLPYGFAAKDFMDRHGFAPNRSAVVQLLNGHLQPSQIILFIHRSI